ncbi:MAG: V-type ATPase 116kDa subunit family protein [Oscillibacter sp.]
MAIVKMKKLRVMAMAERREELLEELLRLGCVEVSEPDGKLADPAWSALLRRGSSSLTAAKGAITDVNTALAAIKKYAKLKDGLFIQRHPITEGEFLGTGSVEEARAVSERIGGFLQELARLQNEENRLLTKQAGLVPWKDLDLPLETAGTEHMLVRLLVCPGATDRTALQGDLADAAAELTFISGDKQQAYCLLLCHRAEEERVMEILRPRSFSVVTFQGMTGTPAENIIRLDEKLVENRRDQEAITTAIVACGRARDALRVYADRLSAEAARETSAERLLTNGTILFFEGWAPGESMDAVGALLDSMNCAWEAEDPTPEEYPDVPVKLKNNWLTKSLNMVTEMYSLPAYDNVDPNPLMAPFFILFYGIMMADMGYGTLMMIASLVVLKKYRPKGTMEHFFGLLGLCGVSTFIMGAMTGGFLGDFIPQFLRVLNPASTFELPALFTPLDDTLMILIGAMCLGFVQIVTGMAISFINKLKNRQYMDALWEEVTWWVVFAGTGLAVTGVTMLVLYVGIVMVLVGAGWTAKGFGKVTAVFGSLYNHVTGYFGDILSYSRLMALMLAGSVIAQVFNTLGAIPGNIFIFILISLAGNTLNFALNLLGCYVHDLRLQCLEYFGKFYQDGGKPFKPLAINTKYVDIQKD